MATEGPLRPSWEPTPEVLRTSNLSRLMRERGFSSYEELFAWSVGEREAFWGELVARLGIRLRRPGRGVVDLSGGPERPQWLPGARLNIAESCFQSGPEATAIIQRREGGELERWSTARLESLSRRVACGLRRASFSPGDAIAVDMPMHAESVAIYLGLVLAGCQVVSIADSFAPDEIASRLRIAGAAAVFTQDYIRRGGRLLPLYEKVVAAGAPTAIVLASAGAPAAALRAGDRTWSDFLPAEEVDAVIGEAQDTINVLFSSGTTGDPKAIPWTQTTPIKCAADGHLHQDVRAGDVVAWPTNLGWMMGPWLIFAALINRAAIALYVGNPSTREFCEFVQDAGVNVLGLVPSLVKAWRASGALEGLDWSAVRVLSSTGEASSPPDYRWLMERVGAPVVEYCGGTEIGGGYVTGTVLQPAVPSCFTTPTLGLDLVLLDEEGRESDEGEVFLVGPSMGLSTRLLNRDHHQVYFAGTPRGPGGEPLRRHGDRLERLPEGGWRAHGRTDDAMNLGGIKVGSAEIERVLDRVPGVLETAAVAVPPPGGGPAELVVFAVLEAGAGPRLDELTEACRREIRERLNPLFRLAELRLVDSLPRTASNKVMRRVLREGLRED